MEVRWTDGFEISVRIQEQTAVITANTEGLLSLARQLEDLAQAAPGSHLHYDAYNALEDGSAEMIVEKMA